MNFFKQGREPKHSNVHILEVLGAHFGAQALELRDKDKERFLGKGCLKAVANINDVIAPKLLGLDPTKQTDIDKLMVRAPPVLESARCHLECVSKGMKQCRSTLETHSERAQDILSDPDYVQLAPDIVLLSIEKSATFT